MIVVDLEMSGWDPCKNGIVAIGAIDFFNPERQFYVECRLDKEDKITRSLTLKESRAVSMKRGHVAKIVRFSEEEMRDPRKPSQKEALENFFKWTKRCRTKILIGQNPSLDYAFLVKRAIKYKLSFPFGKRIFDLHSIASLRHFQIRGRFQVAKGKSKMNLMNISKFCGIKAKEIHNALEDAKLEAECFSRLVFGKGLLKEYEKFKLPKYLLKDGERASRRR